MKERRGLGCNAGADVTERCHRATLGKGAIKSEARFAQKFLHRRLAPFKFHFSPRETPRHYVKSLALAFTAGFSNMGISEMSQLKLLHGMGGQRTRM